MKTPAAFSPLQIALGVSVAVHAALLTVRFVNPEAFNRVFQDTPLEVVLVNARSEDKPDKAQAIAQANLTGGGEAERGRATSPLPPSAQARLGAPVEEEEKRIEAMKEQQNRMLAQIRKQLASYRVNETPETQRTQDEQEREERRLALDSDEFRRAIPDLSPTGKVPVLHHAGRVGVGEGIGDGGRVAVGAGI